MNVGLTWMAKCNQLTSLPFKGLIDQTRESPLYYNGMCSNVRALLMMMTYWIIAADYRLD